jgi:pimeloyl-ACP methyl ester carboxylesterase
VILVDARGHGGSDKPHDPAAYPLETRAADVVAVLDALDIVRSHYWGYSMGGWIGFGMAKFAPERIDRLVIGGQHPYTRNSEELRQMVRTGIADGNDAFVVAAEEMWGFKATPEIRERLGRADLQAYLAMAQDRPSLEATLPGMRMPCCFYSGEADPACEQAKSASRLIPDGHFFSLPGLSLAGAFQRSDLVLPRVFRFCGARPDSSALQMAALARSTRWRRLWPRSARHPTRQLAPTVMNAGFAPHRGRSRGHYRTAEVDPSPTPERDELGSCA